MIGFALVSTVYGNQRNNNQRQANQRQENQRQVPAPVVTMRYVELFRFNQSRGEMVRFAQARVRRTQTFHENAFLPHGRQDGWGYFIRYNLVAYRTNQVWVNINSPETNSNIEGFRMFLIPNVGFVYSRR